MLYVNFATRRAEATRDHERYEFSPIGRNFRQNSSLAALRDF